MTTDDQPDDPFTRSLGGRMRAAADQVTGSGVTRAGVEERRRARVVARRRVAVLGVAAAVAVLAGLAVAARPDAGARRLRVATDSTTMSPGPTTTADGCTDAELDRPLGAGWVPLSAEQVAVLADGGLITGPAAGGGADEGYQVTLRMARLLEDAGVGLDVDQRDAAGIDMAALAAGPCATRDVAGTTMPDSPDSPDALPATTTTLRVRPDGPAQQPMADAVGGQALWAVYVDAWAIPTPGTPEAVATTTAPDGHDAISTGEDRWWAAEARVGHLGDLPTLTPLSCDEGADSLAFEPSLLPLEPGTEAWAVGVYFTTEADARAFAELLPGPEAALGPIRRTCTID